VANLRNEKRATLKGTRFYLRKPVQGSYH
jgi:hypothetical protein